MRMASSRIRSRLRRPAGASPRSLHGRLELRPMTKPEIGVFLPQMGFTYAEILHRARRCDDLGIDSLWLYDHLYGPGAPDYPSMEAWTLGPPRWLSQTERNRGRTHGAVQSVSASRGTRQDGHHAGSDLGWPPFNWASGSGSLEDEHTRVRPWTGERFAERSATAGRGHCRSCSRLLRMNESTSQASISPCVTCPSSRDRFRQPRPPNHRGGRRARSTRCRW